MDEGRPRGGRTERCQTHLTDWRSQRARLPPAELRREEPRDAAAAAALEAGLDDLEALFA